jgi:hypothetical protein
VLVARGDRSKEEAKVINKNLYLPTLQPGDLIVTFPYEEFEDPDERENALRRSEIWKHFSHIQPVRGEFTHEYFRELYTQLYTWTSSSTGI